MNAQFLKQTFAALVLSFTLALAIAQPKEKRQSPPDSAVGKAGTVNVKINYGSPSVKGRQVWGALVPYNQVWRAGANEATTINFSGDVKIEGKTLPAGKYAFFVIPTENDWTVIFNKTAGQWGAYSYDEKQDALRVTVKPRKAAAFSERLVYSLTGDAIVLKWENLEVPVGLK